eukprot:scaffold4.g4892.t1
MAEQQIGLVAALRPWLSLPAGALWSGVADKSRRHRAVLLLTFACSVAVRLALSAGRSFAALTILSLVTEFFAAPVTIIADSAVLAACSHEGEYGRQRLWGAIGWGVCSAVAGLLITHVGIYAAFLGHAALALAAAVPTALVPLGPLQARLDQQGHQPLDAGACDDGAASHGGCVAAGKRGGVGVQASKRDVRRFDSASEASLLVGAGRAEPMQVAQHAEAAQQLASRDSSNSVAAGDACRHLRGQQQHIRRPEALGAVETTEEQAAAPLLKPGSAAGGVGASECQRPRVQFWGGVQQLLRTPEAVLFFCQALLIGFGVGNIEGYLFLYLDELGGSATLMGLSLSVTCAAESAVFYFFPVLLAALGIQRCLHLVFAGFVLRLGAYFSLAWWPSPWLVLPVETLHGLTFALAWAGAVGQGSRARLLSWRARFAGTAASARAASHKSACCFPCRRCNAHPANSGAHLSLCTAGTAYCGRIAPPGLESTVQSLFQGLMFGMGHGLGGLVGGAVYHSLGAQAVYLAACAVLLAGWAACTAVHAALGTRGLLGTHAPAAVVELAAV